MFTRQVVSSARRSLSHLLQTQCQISTSSAVTVPTTGLRSSINGLRSSSPPSRFFSSTGGGGEGSDIDNNNNNNDNSKTNKDGNDDPFGVSFEDGDDKLGPKLPPKYKRDSATGKLTGDIEAELTAEEREILHMDPLERDKLVLKRLVQSWEGEKIDKATGDPQALADFGRRVRLAKMSLNVLGRTVKGKLGWKVIWCVFDLVSRNLCLFIHKIPSLLRANISIRLYE